MSDTLKVVLLGNSGVGKTCLRSQFVHHVFTNAYKATIGGDYLTTNVEIDGADGVQRVNLQIWDTAGQERFNSISQAFYRGTDVVLLVYDITNYDSVVSLRDWFRRFMQHCHVERPGVMVVGNKSDRAGDRVIDMAEIKHTLADAEVSVDNYIDWDLDLREISSKHLDQVQLLFKRVAEIGVRNDQGVGNPKPNNLVGFDIDLDPPQRAGCAC